MSDHEARARAWLAENLFLEYNEYTQEELPTNTETISSLATILREAEAKGLEQEAVYWDTMAEGPWKDGDDFTRALAVAQRCRDQAKRVREGTPPPKPRGR